MHNTHGQLVLFLFCFIIDAHTLALPTNPLPLKTNHKWAFYTDKILFVKIAQPTLDHHGQFTRQIGDVLDGLVDIKKRESLRLPERELNELFDNYLSEGAGPQSKTKQQARSF